MPASIINYLQVMPELAQSCVQTSTVTASKSDIAFGLHWSKKMRKTKDELVIEH